MDVNNANAATVAVAGYGSGGWRCGRGGVADIGVWEGGRTIRIEVATGYTVGTIAERQFVSDRMDERVYNIIIHMYII